MRATGLVLAGAWAYRRVLLPIVGVALVAGLCVGGLSAVREHVAAANRASASLPVPHGVVMLSDLPAERAELVVAAGGAPVRDGECVLLTTGAEQRAVDASVRFSSDPVPPRGVVVEGRAAGRAGEIVLARAIVDELGVQLGDQISCEGATLRVVGTMVDPADRDARTSDARVAPFAPVDATAWVVRVADYLELPEDVVGVTSDEATTKALQGFGPGGGPPVQLAWSVLAAALLSAAVIGFLGQRAYQRDLAVCVQLGASRRGLQRRIAAVGTAAGAAAALLGGLLAQTGVNLLRGELDAVWSQYWLAPRWSSWSLLLVTVVMGTGPLLLVALATWLSSRPRVGTDRGSLLVLVLLFGGQVAFGCFLWAETSFYDAAPWLGNAVLMIVVGALARLLRPTSRDALAALVREGMKGTAALALVMGVVLFYLAFSLARADNQFARDASLDLADSGQRPGSLVIRNVPGAAGDELAEAYVGLGGTEPAVVREVRWSGAAPEVVTPRLARCVAEDPSIEPTVPPVECLGPQDWFGKVFGVGALQDASGPARAAHEIVRDGRVGLVVRGEDGQVRTAEVDAAEDLDLGLNMPGLVLDEEALADLGGTPSDEVAMYFEDYATLGASERTRFRAAVLSAAPSAYPLQNDPFLDSVWGVERPRTHLVTLVLAVVGTVVLVGVLMAGLVGSSTALRRAWVVHGGDRRTRRRLATRILAVPLLTCLLAPLLARATLWVMQRTATFDFSAVGAGWRWALPGLVSLCVVALAAFRLARFPQEDQA